MNLDIVLATAAFLALALAGAAGGALLARHRLRSLSGGNPDEIQLGAWTTNTHSGSSAASALTRARIAINGILALHRQEAVYFFSGRDDLGNPLDPAHDWEITGRGFACRWWSFTLYDEEQQLIESLSRRYSVHSDNVVPEPDGSYRIVISRSNPGTNWLASGNAARLTLTIRLYNPTQAVLDDVRSVKLPSIRKLETRANRGMIVLVGVIAGVVLFILSYRLVLVYAPIKLMAAAEQRLLSIRDSGPNTFRHGRAPTHKSRQIVMPSPDLVYSSCVYDLAAGDLMIAGELPPEGHYWSLSLYAHNTDNYFVLNDRELPARRFSITVSRKSGAGGGTVASPTRRGIALIRMIQRKGEDLPIIQASQQSIRCDVVKA